MFHEESVSNKTNPLENLIIVYPDDRIQYMDEEEEEEDTYEEDPYEEDFYEAGPQILVINPWAASYERETSDEPIEQENSWDAF